jgi:hypothetical protein
MSTDTSTDMTLKVHDYQPATDVITQYGMRYPDGTIKWGQSDSSLNPVVFKHLQQGATNAVRRWEESLAKRAKDASLDLEEYSGQHMLVKRTVVVAVTVNEEVGLPITPKVNPWAAPPVPAPPFE